MKWLERKGKEWKLKLNLRDLFEKFEDTEPEDEDAQESGKEVAKRIRALIKSNKDSDKLSSDAQKMLLSVADDMEIVENVEDFDFYMNDLYSIGDEYSIWIAAAF